MQNETTKQEAKPQRYIIITHRTEHTRCSYAVEASGIEEVEERFNQGQYDIIDENTFDSLRRYR